MITLTALSFVVRHPLASFLAIALLMHVAAGASGNDVVVHWINSASQNAVTVLNASATFTTDFKGANDVQVTKLSGQVNSIYTDNYSTNPGNNPNWVTSFVGNFPQGTGDGNTGHWKLLESSFNTCSVQLDFALPLVAGDRMLVADVESNEQYKIEAFVKTGAGYSSAPLNGWIHQSFSGQTGVTPDSRWAYWNPISGLLTASTSSNLNEPLDVLIPDQTIDRIVFTRDTLAGGGSAEIQFAAVSGFAGDYNQNGVVDGADYVVWRHSLGQSVPIGTGADGNFDGQITQADYDVWRAHFGQTAGSGAGVSTTAAVPEPATLVMLMFAVGSRCLQRSRSE